MMSPLSAVVLFLILVCPNVSSAVLPGASQKELEKSLSFGGQSLPVGDVPWNGLSCDPWSDKKCVKNRRPIIGIIAQKLLNHRMSQQFPSNSSYIAASYVKWIESAGARVVPIMIDQSDGYYEEIFASVNGILFPGGSASLIDSGYATAGRLLYSLAAKSNAEGKYFPIWGTCLGFEFLSVIYSDPTILSSCSGENISLSLDFQQGYQDSRMFRDASPEILEIFNRENTTANSHHFCVSLADFQRFDLNKRMRLLSTSTDARGETFVSAVEDLQYPIFGVQFHPEKSNFEWRINAVVSHSADAVLVSQYLANFFVTEARKNSHRFSDHKKEQDALIYNWNPIFSKTMVFDQIYLF